MYLPQHPCGLFFGISRKAYALELVFLLLAAKSLFLYEIRKKITENSRCPHFEDICCFYICIIDPETVKGPEHAVQSCHED